MKSLIYSRITLILFSLLFSINVNAELQIQKTDIKLSKKWQDLNNKLFKVESKNYYHTETVDYKKGLKIANKALETAKKEVGESHLATAYSYNNQAILLVNNDKFDEALKSAKKSLSILNSLFGDKKNYRHADVLNTMAYIYLEKEELKTVKNYLNEAKSILSSNKQQNLNSEDKYRMMLVDDSFVELMHYQEASSETLIVAYQDLIEKYGDLMESDGKLYTMWINNLAEEHRNIEEYDEAYELHKQNLDLRKRKLTPNHKHLETSYNNMALLYFGDKISLKEATYLIDKSLDIAKHRKTYDSESGFYTRLNKAFIITNESEKDEEKRVFNKLLDELEVFEKQNTSDVWIPEYKTYITEHLQTLND